MKKIKVFYKFKKKIKIHFNYMHQHIKHQNLDILKKLKIKKKSFKIKN